MKKLLPLILALLMVIPAAAQPEMPNYYFRNIRKQDGLSQTDIKAILQSRDGFMWFGTRNKLNRYDGRSFKIYDCYDREKNFRNNNVSALYEDDDRQLWVGTDKGVFRFDPVSERFSFIDTKTADGTTMIDWVADIKADAAGALWIVVPNQGVFRYNPDGTLRRYPFGDSNPNHGQAGCISIDRGNRVWIGTNGSGVYRYNAETDAFDLYLGDSNGSSTLDGDNIYCMCDLGEELLIGVHEGKLRSLNKRRNTVSDMDTPDVHYKIIRDIKCYDDKIWVGTQAGIYVIDRQTGKTAHIHADPMCSFALSDNQIGKIYRDRENGIWIGTNLGGINYLSPYTSNFARFVPMSGNSVSSKRVRSLTQGDDGNIWITTEDAGVCVYDEQSHHFSRIGKDFGPALTDDKGLTILHSGSDIWVGFFKNGLDVVDSHGRSRRHYSSDDLGFNDASIYAMCEDSDGNVWLGTGWSVYVGDPRTMRFRLMPEFGYNYVFDIMEDSEKNIWVITMGNGVYRYTPANGTVKHFTHDENDPSTLSSNSVNSVFESSRGEIWLSTDRGGICRYNADSDTFTNFGPGEGLPDDTAYKMLEDKNGFLWFGTNNGLVRFNSENGSARVYTTGNGLPSNQFGYSSAFKSASGKFYFGCSEGLTSFDPENIAVNDSVPPVYITKLFVNDREVVPGEPGSPLSKNIIYTDQITLPYDQNMIGFEFAVLSYVVPNANVYAYKMDNVNSDWVYTSDNNTVTYANLAPGRYTFRLKGANSDGRWNDSEVRMSIIVSPPWWKTRWAMTLFGLVVLAMLWFSLRKWSRKLTREEKEREQNLVREKENELYRYKLDLYVKIAHEIRTPVTLINGPLETLLDMNMADPEISRNLKTMRRSVKELIDITNQLLDFRKLDSKKMDVNLGELDILPLISEKVAEFDRLSEQRGIEFSSLLPPDELVAIADRNALIKILNNIFSNAFRYCKSCVILRAGRDDRHVTITLLNDGNVIAPEFQEKIFDPFYQMADNANADSSTGIGLNLARSLAEMLNGTLTYSIVDGLNCFTLTLEAGVSERSSKAASVVEDVKTDIIADPETADAEEEEPAAEKSTDSVILIVEDNAELLSFLAGKLGNYYDVLTAANGREALEILADANVSMVVTDIMMPEIDGIELCSRIKENIETSHIPVILLTAKNDLDSKVTGLRAGADAYIEKPFSFKYLHAQIDSIFENRHRDKESFNRNPFINQLNVGVSEADRELIDKVTAAIEDNITNPNFGVEMLAEIVCLSRSSLHRKIKAVSDTSPTDFIRLIRLKKATEMITQGKYRVGEICYLVGINSPSYFTKLFQRQFGMTPKEFEKRQRQKAQEERDAAE